MQTTPMTTVSRCASSRRLMSSSDLLEELVALELDAEHLAQLAADDDQRRAKDVADQDRLGEQSR